MKYTKEVTYLFEVDGEEFAAKWTGEDILVEETRKNGQEDCHMNGTFTKDGDSWVCDEDQSGNIEDYAEAIAEYLTLNPLPKE